MLKPYTMETPSYFTFLIANNKGANQTEQMCRLICAFVGCKQQSKSFSYRDSYDVEANAPWPPPSYAPESVNIMFIMVIKWPVTSLESFTLNNINFRGVQSVFTCRKIKVSKGAKIRNGHNQVPHLTQDTKAL